MPTRRVHCGRLEGVLVEPTFPQPSKPPLVLIHGLGGGVWGWEGLQARCAQRGFSSYALELPFHGADAAAHPDPLLGEYSVESFALYVAGALAAIGPCYVVGHSMGGLIAQKLAETQTQHGYVFIASAPPWSMMRRPYWPLWKHLLRQPLRLILGSLTSRRLTMNRAMEDDLINNRLPVEVREAVYLRDVPDSGRASLQMVLGLVSVDPRPINSPCLVIGGKADRLIPPSEQERIAAHLKAPLLMLDRGHMLLIEEGWEELADGILHWIAQLRSTSLATDAGDSRSVVNAP